METGKLCRPIHGRLLADDQICDVPQYTSTRRVRVPVRVLRVRVRVPSIHLCKIVLDNFVGITSVLTSKSVRGGSHTDNRDDEHCETERLHFADTEHRLSLEIV